MSMRWCGMPRRPSTDTLSVPMSKPRYTAVESQLMISPPCRSASASPSALLPDAVGPRTATTSGRTSHDIQQLPTPNFQFPRRARDATGYLGSWELGVGIWELGVGSWEL